MLQTYERVDRREDLLSILKDVSPLDGNYLMDNLGTSTATNTLHEWPTLFVSRATSVTAAAEGFAAGEGSPTDPGRSNNYTAILKREVKVSRTMRKSQIATGKDPMLEQKGIALRQLKQDMEFVLVNGSKSSGASGSARGLAGLDGVISSHVTARTSGTSISVTEIDDMIAEVYNDVGQGYVGKTLLVPINSARTIAGFTTNITNYVNTSETVYNNVRTYQGVLGEVKVVPHKDVRSVGGSVTHYLINDEMFKVAYFDKPMWKELPFAGDADYGMYVTELTLESLAEKASAKRTGYKAEKH